ncbi:formimidoylglutamate deiminase [Terrarubrum flagellatum]|uniref:formimidoylglutamate deiminase n=1 Tax=Terrirubrum flagellatum TaxID=2895980 RepID=UPI003144EAE5
MEILHLAQALMAEGIVENVRVTVADGVIMAAEPRAERRPDAMPVSGLTVPGMPNLHSHAFQRGMAGLSEKRGQQEDSFWTWREVMYGFLDRLTPDDVRAIAAQAYVEMVEHGFTSVAEFHYLHHDIDGRPYGDVAAMASAIAEAARESNIGLTLLPVFYRFGNFGGAPPTPGQRRFVSDRELFGKLHEASGKAIAGLPDARLGIAPHSLRAVSISDLVTVKEMAKGGPIHIHVAEQQKEVDDCIAWGGKRPVELLFDSTYVGEQWCLIHATHLTEEERNQLGESSAVAGLCPVTEANLGDGVFDGVNYRDIGGRFGVGTDSNIEIGVGAELRMLEYSQRLRDQRRSLLAELGGSVGRTLYESALAGGAQACGRKIGKIAPGCRADLVTLDSDHPALVGRRGDALIDSAIFAIANPPVAEVRVGGVKVVDNGRHFARETVARRYGETMRRLLS